MAPTLTRSMAKSDPEYVHERYTPRKRAKRSIQKEQIAKKQKLAREKLIGSKRDGLVDEDVIIAHFGIEHVTGVNKCQENLETTAVKLMDLAKEIEGYNSEGLSESVRGDIEAFCGKARLLVTSKLQKQYQKMIDDALSPTYTPPTKVSDLTGFWEMVELQIDQAEGDYTKLIKLKENNWVAIEEIKKAPTKVLKPKNVNKPAPAKNAELAKARAEKMKAFKAQMKAAKALQKDSKTDENSAPVQLQGSA